MSETSYYWLCGPDPIVAYGSPVGGCWWASYVVLPYGVSARCWLRFGT